MQPRGTDRDSATAAAYGQCQQPEAPRVARTLRWRPCSAQNMIRGGRTCLEELAACFVISQPGVSMCDAHSEFRLAVHNLHQLSTICADKSWSHFSIHERDELFLNMIQTGRNNVGLEQELHHGNWFGLSIILMQIKIILMHIAH